MFSPPLPQAPRRLLSPRESQAKSLRGPAPRHGDIVEEDVLHRAAAVAHGLEPQPHAAVETLVVAHRDVAQPARHLRAEDHGAVGGGRDAALDEHVLRRTADVPPEPVLAALERDAVVAREEARIAHL